jgi:hypothetical protein
LGILFSETNQIAPERWKQQTVEPKTQSGWVEGLAETHPTLNSKPFNRGDKQWKQNNLNHSQESKSWALARWLQCGQPHDCRRSAGYEFIAIKLMAQALLKSQAQTRVRIGDKATRGLVLAATRKSKSRAQKNRLKTCTKYSKVVIWSLLPR